MKTLLAIAAVAALLVVSSATAAPAASQASATPPAASGDQGDLASAQTGASSSPSGATLPYTGIDLRVAIVAGALLVAGGTAVRRRSQSRADA